MASSGPQSGNGVAWGSEQVVEQTLEQTEQASRAEWYVAEDDVEVGPLTLEDVEARWRSGDLQEDTPVWRPGMENWAPLIEVQDLTYLVINLPQSEEPKVILPEPSWKPVTIDSLADLAAWELEEAEQRALPDEHSGLPSYLEDFESLGFQHKRPTDDPFALVSTQSMRRLTPPTPWPAARHPESEPRFDLTWILLGLLGVATLVLVGILIAVLTRNPAILPAPAGLQPELAPIARPVARPAPEPMPLEPVLKREPAPEPEPRGPEPVAEPEPAEPPARLSRPALKPPSRVSRPAAPPTEGRAGGTPLTREKVVAGIKKNAKSLSPCLKRARSSGELLPGRHRFILAWVIRPDGSVVRPRLKGPRTVLETSLPGCFESKMRKWTFVKSTKGSSVRNFPLPVTMR